MGFNRARGGFLTKNESYRVRFFHGVTERNEPIYSYKEVSHKEHVEITESLRFIQLRKDVDKAYDHVVKNYRDYELSNFSTILDHVLSTSDPNILLPAMYGIDRHISNLLSSTYLYTSLHRIKRKDNDLDDYSYENSNDGPAVHKLKSKFKCITNDYHKKYYQYTFISALRNKINHGGVLEKRTRLGGEWSLSYEPIDLDKEFSNWRKDKKYSIFDQAVLKDDARKIIDNSSHYSAVKDSIPDTFYVREAMRRYIDLLSNAHAEVLKDQEGQLEAVQAVLSEALDYSEKYIHASIVAFNESDDVHMGSSGTNVYSSANTAKSPLYLERYAMPGESQPCREMDKGL